MKKPRHLGFLPVAAGHMALFGNPDAADEPATGTVATIALQARSDGNPSVVSLVRSCAFRPRAIPPDRPQETAQGMNGFVLPSVP